MRLTRLRLCERAGARGGHVTRARRSAQAIAAWWGAGWGCPGRCGRALWAPSAAGGGRTSGWRGAAAPPGGGKHSKHDQRRHALQAYDRAPGFMGGPRECRRRGGAHPQHVHSVVVRAEVFTQGHQEFAHLHDTNKQLRFSAGTQVVPRDGRRSHDAPPARSSCWLWLRPLPRQTPAPTGPAAQCTGWDNWRGEATRPVSPEGERQCEWLIMEASFLHIY